MLIILTHVNGFTIIVKCYQQLLLSLEQFSSIFPAVGKAQIGV